MGHIIILGLGPGDPRLLTQEAAEELAAASEVWLRTERHPTVSHLPAHLTVHSFDHLYEGADDFTMKDCEECHISERVNAFRYKPMIHGGAH